MTRSMHARSRTPTRRASLSATAVAAALMAGSLAGCSPDQPGPSAPAQAYFDAYHAALAAGITNAAQFYAPEVEVDYETVFEVGSGRGRLAQALRDWYQEALVAIGGLELTDTVELEPFEPVYVSTDAALDPVVQELFHPEWHTVNRFVVTGAGIEREAYAGSSAFNGDWFDIPRTASEPVADEFVRAWGTSDVASVAMLYAEAATVRDTLRQVHLTGPGQIAAASSGDTKGGALPAAALHAVDLPSEEESVGTTTGPPHSVPAVFTDVPGRNSATVERITLLIDVGDAEACRESIGVVLWLDEQRLITREERFHRVDSLDRCWEELPSGVWWESVPVPDPIRFAMTGITEVTGQQVALWNGTPTREELLEWALARFPTSGLPLPDLTSTTFAPPDPDPWTTYGFVKGAPDVVLPSTWAGCPDEGCEAWPAEARTAAMAELARTWLAGVDRHELMASYAEGHGLEWTARRAVESEPALDRAAATLVWGLMDEEVPPTGPIGQASCEELEVDFADLTGAAPVRPCPTTE